MPTITTTTNAPIVTAAAIRFVQLLLANRATLRGHPALINLGAFGAGRPGSGSLTSQFSLFGLDGYDTLASVAEGAAVTETALTMALRTIAVARRSLRRSLSDQMRTVDPTGTLNIPRFAIDGFVSANVTLTNLIAAMMSGFASSVGSSGVDFDHDTFLEAKATLIEAKVPGPYLSLMPETHFSRWMVDLEGRAGVTQWRPATAEMQMLKGPGFQGTYDNVDIITAPGCPTSGSDHIGGMFGLGAIGYAEMPVEYPQSAFILLQEGPIAVEEIRTGTSGLTDTVTHYHVGTVEIEDARGVQLLAA